MVLTLSDSHAPGACLCTLRVPCRRSRESGSVVYAQETQPGASLCVNACQSSHELEVVSSASGKTRGALGLWVFTVASDDPCRSPVSQVDRR